MNDGFGSPSFRRSGVGRTEAERSAAATAARRTDDERRAARIAAAAKRREAERRRRCVRCGSVAVFRLGPGNTVRSCGRCTEPVARIIRLILAGIEVPDGEPESVGRIRAALGR